MLKVAVINDYQNVFRQMTDWTPLEKIADVTFFQDHLTNEAAIAQRLSPFDVVITERERTHFTATLFSKLDRLKLLVTTGSHNRFIDFAAAAARGVTVTKTEAVMSAAPELTWGLILSLTRRIAWDHAAIRTGGWQTGVGTSIRGKTLGIIGMGVTGKQMVLLAHAFGMKTVAWSRSLDEAGARAAGTTRVELDELLRSSDVVSLHLVLGDRTRGMFGRRELGLMKPSAFLINTSRGPLVDEQALIEALVQRRIAGAGLDVYDQEPLPTDYPLRRLDNVVLTPHTGYITDEQYALCWRQAVENVLAYAAGAPIRVMTEP